MPTTTTRVLLVEDNPADVRLIEEALRDVPGHGLLLSPVATLREAIAVLGSGSYDAALLDLTLPDAEGLEILYDARREAPGLPIVVLTGRDDADLAVNAVRLGAQDYLVKGRVEGQVLVRSLRYAIERRKALDAVERSERHFRKLIENAWDLIAVVDREWVLKFVSPSVERICGYPAEGLLGASLLPLIHPEDVARLREGAEAAGQNGDIAKALEIRVRHSDGNWRVIEATARNLFDDPVVTGLVINAHEITERKSAEHRLQDLNARLTAVIENAPLGVVQMDLSGRVVSWSQGAERIFGWREDEVVGQLLPFANYETILGIDARTHPSERGEPLPPIELRHQRRSGTPADLQLWTGVLRSASGTPTGSLVVIADVTEQKQLEGQFRHAQKMEAVGRLAGGVAHDFNNLLTIISGYAQLASQRMLSDEAGFGELQEVLSAADRAAGLTKQLLALSRRHVVQPAPMGLNELLGSVARMLKRLVGDGVEIVMKKAADVPPVMADRSQIELVLLNLAANARDAMPMGGTLTVETLRLPDGRAGLRVIDTGTGMSDEALARAFEPFFTTKEEGKGTGLGLSTSYSIIKQHGGEIALTTAPGVGSQFEIRLPAMPAGTVPAPAPNRARPDLRGEETVLVAESDPVVARVIRETLVSLGYAVLAASGETEAAAVARDFPGPIDLMITDMRGGRGLDLAREIRSARPGIALLVVSGQASSNSEVGEIGEHSRILAKPFNPETLAREVRELLDRSKGEAGG